MKKVYLLLFCFVYFLKLTAQQPQQFSYQTVVRGSDNLLVVNKMIGIRISLLQGSENGDVVYVEKHTPSTNANGLASIAIGTGSNVLGNFSAINWSKGPYFIKTETDPAGISNYSLTTISQLLSVPYALYAGNGIKRISANSDTIFLSNNDYYINKSSTSTGNSSIPSGGGQNQVLSRCDGELTWTNNGFCPGKISSLDCNYTVVQQGTFVKNINDIKVVYKFNYKGGNNGLMDNFGIQSTGVFGLSASVKSGSNLLNNGDGSFEIIIQGTPSSSGKANFSFTFCGKSCSFSVDVQESNISSLDCNYTIVQQGKLVKNDSSSITLRFNYTGGNLGTGDYINVQSTGVVGLNAYGGVSRLNNGNGTFDVTVSGKPTSSGNANFAFTFCGKSCNISVDVLESIGKYQSPLTDIDGNEYKTTLIGKQVWMAENLKVTRFNDGTIIKAFVPSGNYTSDSVARLASIWSYYNNDASNSKYGKLYTWYTISPTTNGNKNVCPFGWHVPTATEYQELISYLYLGGYNQVVKKIKQTGILDWSLDASNSSLFSALPSGYMDHKGRSYQLNTNALWWTNTIGDLDQPNKIGSSCSYIIDRDSWNNYQVISQSYKLKSYGLSVRCVKD